MKKVKVCFSLFIVLLVLILSISHVFAYECGDVDLDGDIDIIDALHIIQYYLCGNPTDFDLATADVNADNNVDVLDALLIAQYYVGVIDELQCQEPIEPGPDYENIIKEWAKENDVDFTGYNYFPVDEDTLQIIFPDFNFYACHIRYWPVQYGPINETIGTHCIFAIDNNEHLTLITDIDSLASFYQANQQEMPDLKNAMTAWLTLSQQFKNDGYYTFQISEQDITIEELMGDLVSYRVEGVCRVVQGGEGLIKAFMLFDFNKQLQPPVNEEVELIEGVRPICQSTKLLDPDPIIRKMAENDLMAMGIAAKPYLDEMREKAPKELQVEMDRLWIKIVIQEEKRQKIYALLD